MRAIAFLLASFACTGHGRVLQKTRIQKSLQEPQSHGKALSRFLLAFNQANPGGRQVLDERFGRGSALSKRVHNHAILMRQRSDFEEDPLGTTPEKVTKPKGFDISKATRDVQRGFIRLFIDLRFAVAQFIILAVLSAAGTIIEQNKGTEFYETTYGSYGIFLGWLPDDSKNSLANFLDIYLPSPGGIAYLLGFDHMYSSPPFLAFCYGLGLSLAACSFVRQIPMAKSAQKWSFATTEKTFDSFDGNNHVITHDTTAKHVQPRRAASSLSKHGYHVFFGGTDEGGAEGYAFKGLSGRFAPIGVHISMILLILGATYSGLSKWGGDQYVPSGTSMAITRMVEPRGPLSHGFQAQNQMIRVDDFRIAYRDDGSVDQFYADVAMDKPGQPPTPAKTIKVNTPYIKDGFTAYMSDWTIGTVRMLMRPVKTDAAAPESWREFVLPMSPLPSDGSILGTYIPLPGEDRGASKANGLFAVAKDLRQVLVFAPDGSLVGARTAESKQPIEYGGLELVLEEVRGSAGLQCKVDPGVPWVYLGFGGTMATTIASFLSHNQVWLWQTGKELKIGGKTNRLKRDLDEELDSVLTETKTLQAR